MSAPYPLMLHTEDGEILQLSHAWTNLTGYDPSTIATTREWARVAYGESSSNSDEFLSSDWHEGQ
jgi:PAS domain-containing protein